MKNVNKIKVTKQEIRTYESNGRVQSWTYSEQFLKTLLGREGKYEISSKNANVIWYELKQDSDTTEETNETKVVTNNFDVLESDGFIVTDSVKDRIDNYSIEELKKYAKNGKISGHTLSKIDKANNE